MFLRTGKVISLVAALLIVLPACEWIEEHPKTVMGAGIGAAGGAIAGGLYKGEKGMLVGAFIGALAGGAIGAYLDHKDKTAAETNVQYGYQPAQGVQLDLVNVAAAPSTVAPGGSVSLQATYALMAPDPAQALLVTESRLVTLNGVTVAQNEIQLDRAPGTYTSSVPITLPATAEKGTYQLLVTVTAAGQSMQRAAAFTVN